jgi:hypothetical protein
VGIDILVFGAFVGYLYLFFEQSTANVVMTSFEKEPVFLIGNSTTGQYLDQPFNLSIANHGSSEVGIFTLVIQVVDNGSVIETSTAPLGYLQPGDHTFDTDVFFNATSGPSPSTVTYTALLKWYNLVISQRNLS